MMVLFLVSCDDDSDMMESIDPPVDEVTVTNTITYDLGSVAVPDISGEAIITEFSDNTLTIDLELQNTPDGGQHPAHIHFNTAAEGGGIALTLGTVDGSTGMSSIMVTTLDDGTPVDYDDLVNFDGYINVHLSAEELSTIVAQGDIGQNDLTANSKSYDLSEKAVAGIDGKVTFFERVNGEALSVIELMNTPEGGIHPAHIHLNSAVEGGGIAFSFNPVDGTSGQSKTNVAALDDSTPFGYEEVQNFDGYINVHLSAEQLNVIVAQGDIGSNELTGMSIMYDLAEKDAPGISGMVTFFERKSGEALARIELMNTPAGGMHPAHIHENDAATGGGIAFSFNPVIGDTGMSDTHVAELDNGTPFGYGDIDQFDGYINVHLSMDNLATIVAQGNIGSNANDDGMDAGKSFDVSNSGSSAYIFNNDELDDASNPDITLKRGETYTFSMDASGHPFFIKTVATLGTGDTYDQGVTGNGSESGTITFEVPMDAPDTLFYICEFHSAMTGTINIVD
jgi:Cu/Zn superoxide dismutase/plastocyanin